jgi:hypothetical protein
MTITIAWIRRNRNTAELVLASDSRLRSRGALNQTQKLFRLERGDCCLGFSGDAQIAYPLFMQVSSALNNFIRTRSRAADVTDVAKHIEDIINNLISSWDLKRAEKDEELASTKILFAGWSWVHKRFAIGVFQYKDGRFEFHQFKSRIPHPWKEKHRSLVFIGDYEKEYMEALSAVLERRHEKSWRSGKKEIDFDYELVAALSELLLKHEKTKELTAIGGAPQVVKVYSYGSSLPIVVKNHPTHRFLLGRKLFAWEKTEYPILDLTKSPPTFIYPMSHVPVPGDL